MRSSLALLALAVSSFAADLAPKGNAPDGCSASYDGTFEVTIFSGSSSSKRDILNKRASCSGEGVLVMTLKDGVLKDSKDRTGYVASNYQFQFDDPPQENAVYTSGFSACSNQSLALGSSTVFYQCQSGDFYNLYDRHWASQCEPVEVVMMPCGSSSGNSAKKVVGSIIATTVVTLVSAGVTTEVETTINVPMCQIGDGQVQVRTTPCDDMELPIITAAPVSQVSDGKLQVPTAQPPALTQPNKAADAGTAAEPPAGTAEAVTNPAPAETNGSGVLVTESGAASTAATAKPKTMRTKSSKSESESGTETEEATSATETDESADNTEAGSDASETSSPSNNSSSRGMALTPGAIFALMVGVTWALVSI
ncbi:hypothetical protein B0T10DRAFT_563422 [Thelonectria olida]|uniref:Cell wall mannoprotein PIR1-like C-terminal domain-containing protein n=1 Tax=Thelonectria olida TaxID=1576542 RepID=A0A9P8W2H6_9HYPO|nr:hypothetical protein B0T10DRAFT_563422 [Thelonectria olida]